MVSGRIRPAGVRCRSSAPTSAPTGTITARFADTTLMDAASAGDPVDLSFGYTLSPAQSLLFRVPGVYLPVSKHPVSGPGGIELKYAFQAAKPASGAPFFQVILNNDVQGYSA
ncbi:MAG: phage tail tube protein [Rhodospirillaceae bacterium]